MIAYEKLPKGTSKKTQYGVMIVGLFIGLGLAVQSFITIYALSALFMPVFFPDVNLHLTGSDLTLFIVQAFSGAVAMLMLGYVAFFMDRLSKRALPFSRYTWIPILTTYICVALPRHTDWFTYHLGLGWALGCLTAIPLSGVLPYFFLRTKDAQRLHSR